MNDRIDSAVMVSEWMAKHLYPLLHRAANQKGILKQADLNIKARHQLASLCQTEMHELHTGFPECDPVEETLKNRDSFATPAAEVGQPATAINESEMPQDCLFEPSKSLTGVYFTGLHSDYRCGDTFYPRWASDGNFLNFASKFISADGRKLWLCYSANFTGTYKRLFDVALFPASGPATSSSNCLHPKSKFLLTGDNSDPVQVVSVTFPMTVPLIEGGPSTASPKFFRVGVE